MQDALFELDRKASSVELSNAEARRIADALQGLCSALEAALPFLSSGSNGIDPDNNNSLVKDSEETTSKEVVSVSWLLNLCGTIPSELEPIQLARAIVEASSLTDEAQQQHQLYDLLGDSEQAMIVLIEVMPMLPEISRVVPLEDLLVAAVAPSRPSNSSSGEEYVDFEADRRHMLLMDAMDTAQVAASAKAEVDAINGGVMTTGGTTTTTMSTHTILRSSERQAIKFAEKAAKKAAVALQRAKDAGAILDDVNLLSIDQTSLGDGGLVNRSNQEVLSLQQSLLPEGSREYYDSRGLPKDATREVIGDMERVVIPAARLDVSKLPRRLKIDDIMDAELGKAFAGTTSLNPMQSSTFEVAFHSRDNMMVCAPTGAGKTNVAMLTVAAHFRDVGLIGSSDAGAIETGKKVVYIAPMKALAQEVVEKFSSKLKHLRLIVRELTGDMQLSRAKAESANVIVTTPEKWDVVTRKSGTDANSLGNQCGLLIIDEVHLLADERGAVIESVVSRSHRLVESRQRQLRIVALSATLPNYDDVASFLQVPDRGVFYFGPEYRPVPLQQTFIGVTATTRDRNLKEKRMNEICFDVVLDSLQRGYQVMVFVHSRKGTGDTAKALVELASLEGVLDKNFMTNGKENANGDAHKRFADRVNKSRNRELAGHFENGCGIHHAGMLRGDRKLTEDMFNEGAIKVLCCTATLAWGINLPAHSVVIKGTEVYNPEKGGVVDLSILDVQQIFGRAGRPQFDSSGEATLLTTHDAFPRYMDKLVRPVPIESNFIKQLADHLNAEVVGGTVTNLEEAKEWLKYTYLYVRMLRNPLAYGINDDQKSQDPMLNNRCAQLVADAAKLLASNQMLRLHDDTGNLGVVENGRVAAHYYIQAESVATFNEMFSKKTTPNDAYLLRIICSATEFRNMKLRQEELEELQNISVSDCPFPINATGHDGSGRSLIVDAADKAFVLLQAYISRTKIKGFTLISDMNYIASNAGRITKAVFEMCLKQAKSVEATKLLRIANSVDKQTWWFSTPLRRFESEIKESIYSEIEAYRAGRDRDSFDNALALLDMQPQEVGEICKSNGSFGRKIQSFVALLPSLLVTCDVKPVTGSVLKFVVNIVADFQWNHRWHGNAQTFWLWVEDTNRNRILHSEHLTLSKRTYSDPFVLEFSIPWFHSSHSSSASENLSSDHFNIRLIADNWVGVEKNFPVEMRSIKFPEEKYTFTDLLDLTPLPTTALNESNYEKLYTKFKAFNPIQTQLFHVLYHTDTPVLLGAPTGSGKTMIAELAILRMKRVHPKGICVYIAPLKALARERLREWRTRFGSLNWNVLELSGDTHHDKSVLQRADILVCTPEKWDLISRSWRGIRESDGTFLANEASFVFRVRLLVIDEIHLLGEERGAVLEAIVSRMRFISRYVETQESTGTSPAATRIVGLSTALANPVDLANWIGIDTNCNGPISMRGLYNFRASVRPVPTEIHLQGYHGKHYCPRMATMNKPCFAAIKEFSPTKPTLIFVASRRQTRLTAFDIITYAASDDNPKIFLGCSDDYVESVAARLHDEALRHTITFGIGLHHAGLSSFDRDLVEKMFLSGEIKVLVATATLAWGVNLPAHLVIVKGTEYFDGKTSRYVDYPLTDVLQMIGRAGRPGFDTKAVAVVMVIEDKKNFYKKFLYSPFPVESCFDQRIDENVNAEITSGTIKTMLDCVGYLSWTFFARRVKVNPEYYGAESGSVEHVEAKLLSTSKESFGRLHDSGCIASLVPGDELSEIVPTYLGIAASQFYLSYRTPKQMQLGVKECRNIIMSNLQPEREFNEGDLSPENHPPTLAKFTRPIAVDEKSIAWLLFTLCSTHECDELPVRHNEELLNEELSAEVMWGPDTADLLAGTCKKGQQQYRNIEIFEDPHTKAFLLIQAHLEHVKLPISDYVNDTKSIVENIPRLLGAISYIAASETSAVGSFELLTQCCRTRQVFEAKCRVDQDPLLQLPGIDGDAIRRACGDRNKGLKSDLPSLYELRGIGRDSARSRLQKIAKNGVQSRKISLDNSVDAIYALPNVKLRSASIKTETNKSTGKETGKLSLTFEIERHSCRRSNDAKETNLSVTMTVLVGSFQQRFLLAKDAIRFSRFGNWTVEKELCFDWATAIADGGVDTGRIILRCVYEEIQGLDCEAILRLK